MGVIEKFLDRYAIFIPLTVLVLLLGSWVGRTDIADECGDLGTFKQNGIEYTCGEVE